MSRFSHFLGNRLIDGGEVLWCFHYLGYIACIPNDGRLNIIMGVRGRYLIWYVLKFERHLEQSVCQFVLCNIAVKRHRRTSSWNGILWGCNLLRTTEANRRPKGRFGVVKIITSRPVTYIPSVLNNLAVFADHSGRAVWSMNRLLPLEQGDHGFESHSRHGCLIYMCLYSVFLLSCVEVVALRRADPPSKESYRLCID
jgi:hypothetical protein